MYENINNIWGIILAIAVVLLSIAIVVYWTGILLDKITEARARSKRPARETFQRSIDSRSFLPEISQNDGAEGESANVAYGSELTRKYADPLSFIEKRRPPWPHSRPVSDYIDEPVSDPRLSARKGEGSVIAAEIDDLRNRITGLYKDAFTLNQNLKKISELSIEITVRNEKTCRDVKYRLDRGVSAKVSKECARIRTQIEKRLRQIESVFDPLYSKLSEISEAARRDGNHGDNTA